MDTGKNVSTERPPRYLSIDVLRGIAIVLMIQVHFVDNWSSPSESDWWLYYLSVWLGAIPAPLFAFVTGVSYALWWRKQQANKVPERHITLVTFRRGLFLFVLGLAFNVAAWLPEEIFNWDILTTLGTALMLFAAMRWLPWPVLLLLGAMLVVLSPPLRVVADFSAYWIDDAYEYDFTLRDIIYGYLANGYFPLFPWLFFPLVGFISADAVFATTKRAPQDRRRLALVSIILLAYPLLTAFVRSENPPLLLRYYADGLTEFPASMKYVLGATGIALLSLLALRALLDQTPYEPRRVLLFLKRCSTYSLTLYVLHHLVILWPLWIAGAINTPDYSTYWRNATPAWVALTASVLFIGWCAWWLRWMERRGWYPLESLLRRWCD